MGGLVTALKDNDPDAFKQWLSEGVYELGEPAVTELVLDWLDPSSRGLNGTGSWRGTWG